MDAYVAAKNVYRKHLDMIQQPTAAGSIWKCN
jgi:hypothetical protein